MPDPYGLMKINTNDANRANEQLRLANEAKKAAREKHYSKPHIDNNALTKYLRNGKDALTCALRKTGSSLKEMRTSYKAASIFEAGLAAIGAAYSIITNHLPMNWQPLGAKDAIGLSFLGAVQSMAAGTSLAFAAALVAAVLLIPILVPAVLIERAYLIALHARKTRKMHKNTTSEIGPVQSAQDATKSHKLVNHIQRTGLLSLGAVDVAAGSEVGWAMFATSTYASNNFMFLIALPIDVAIGIFATTVMGLSIIIGIAAFAQGTENTLKSVISKIKHSFDKR